MKSLKLITNILSAIVYVCILGFLAIAAPLVLGYHPVVVLSGSMEPTYHVGSVIYYKAASFEDINVGDPITFVGAEGGAMVTHRVIEKDESARAFGTEGDANGSPDPGMVPYTNVVGKASKISIPYGGYFVNYGKQPIVIGIMVLILLAGTVVDHLAKDDKDDKDGKKSKDSKQEEQEQETKQ